MKKEKKATDRAQLNNGCIYVLVSIIAFWATFIGLCAWYF
jgi:hypothetical protein